MFDEATFYYVSFTRWSNT